MKRFLVLLLVGCGQRAPERAVDPSEHFTGPLTPAQAGEVVAEVNGEKIYADDVKRQMAARGQTAAQAVDELVAAELLAQEAFRRGLADDRDAIDARKRERVRLLLEREFEPTFDGPEDIAAEDMENAFKNPSTRAYYDHARYHAVAYVRAELKKNAPPEAVEAARQAAFAFAARARAAPPASADAFFALAAGLPLNADRRHLYTTSARGPADPTFAAAAFTLEKIGDVSAPVRTPWGWDVLYLKEIIPEVHMARPEAEADLRKKVFQDARRDAWKKWVEGLVARHKVTTRPELLDSVQVDSLVGL